MISYRIFFFQKFLKLPNSNVQNTFFQSQGIFFAINSRFARIVVVAILYILTSHFRTSQIFTRFRHNNKKNVAKTRITTSPDHLLFILTKRDHLNICIPISFQFCKDLPQSFSLYTPTPAAVLIGRVVLIDFAIRQTPLNTHTHLFLHASSGYRKRATNLNEI